MRIKTKYLSIIFCALILATLLFHVPVSANEQEGVYLGTLGPGESISTRNISYGILQVSATNIPEFSTWCEKCSAPGTNTYMKGSTVNSTYSILIDGYSVYDYSSTKSGTVTVDFSSYSNLDATINMPSDYVMTQTIKCVGGDYEQSGLKKDPCGYSKTRKITVTGVMQLYGYDKRPVVISNPQNVSCGTDKTVSFSVVGDKTVQYRWQIGTPSGYANLSDGADQNSVIYSGTNTPTLSVSNTRYTINGTSYRCILIGERGDEVASEPASISVSDTSAPRVKISYTPTEKTYDGVTILISANDADSGLPDKPYYYKGSFHSEKSFKVYDNGTYEIRVCDNAGNEFTGSVSISNISPLPVTTPTPRPTEKPVITPIPIPTETPNYPNNPTPKPTEAVKQSDKSKDTGEKDITKNKKNNDKTSDTSDEQGTEKKVNINNLTNGYKNKAEDKVIDKDYELNLKDNQNSGITEETIDNEIALSEGPEEDVSLSELKSEGKGNIIAISLGILILLFAVLLALIFPVRVENSDELGTWHFCSMKMLSLKGGYSLNLGLLLEDFDSLRLHFGSLFLLIAKGHALTVYLDGTDTIVIDEITQNMVIDYSQVRRG